MIVRPPRDAAIGPRVYDELFSGVDLVPTLLGLLGVDAPSDIEGISHADNLRHGQTSPARSEVYTTKTYHDSFDPIRAVRTKEYSYIENYAARPLLDLPWDIAEKRAGRTVAPMVQASRPARELYDLNEDPTESQNLLGRGASDKVEASRMTSRCYSTTGARKPTTSSRQTSRVPELRSATPRLTCVFTDHRSPAARPSRLNAASKMSRCPGNSFRHCDS